MLRGCTNPELHVVHVVVTAGGPGATLQDDNKGC